VVVEQAPKLTQGSAFDYFQDEEEPVVKKLFNTPPQA